MDNQEKIGSLLREHAAWQNRIAGFKGELSRMNSDLGNELLKLTPRDVPANAEHFQNQFILQKEVLDILRLDLKQFENLLEANQEKPGRNGMEDIINMRDGLAMRMDDFERIFIELGNEFSVFTRGELVSS